MGTLPHPCLAQPGVHYFQFVFNVTAPAGLIKLAILPIDWHWIDIGHEKSQYLLGFKEGFTLALSEADAFVYGGENMGRIANGGKLMTTHLHKISAAQHLRPGTSKAQARHKQGTQNPMNILRLHLVHQQRLLKFAALQQHKKTLCSPISWMVILCGRAIKIAKKTQNGA